MITNDPQKITRRKMISVDQIFSEIGGWGRYQKIMFFIFCLPTFVAGYTVLSLSWTSYDMQYRCLVPGCESTTSAIYDAPFLNYTIPRHHDPTTNYLVWDQCDTFRRKDPASRSCKQDDFDVTNKDKCSRWVYDKSIMKTTIISEFDLSCGRGWMPVLANSLYMGGMFTGSLVLGYISDRFGRKVAMVAAFCIVGATTTAQAFSPSFGVFAALRFLAGIGGMGIFMCCFVMSVESVSNDNRTFCAFVIQSFYGAGTGFVGILAMALPEWRHLQLALGLPSFLFVSYWWLLPESPRWLAAQGKNEQLEKNLRRAAKFNGTEFPDHLMEKAAERSTPNDLTSTKESLPETLASVKESLPEMSVADLFRSATLRWRTCIILYQWCICAMVYYGLSMNATSLGSSVYVNFMLMQFIEIPGSLSCIFIADPWGRKLTLTLGFLLCGVGSIASGFAAGTGIQWLTVTFAMVGKFGGSATFGLVYIYGAELFPTDLRNSGIGLSSAAGRVGSLLAPFIAQLGVNNSQLVPMSIFGGLSLIACVLTLFLPETHGQKLPDTIQETENFGRDQSFCFIPCLIKRRSKTHHTDNGQLPQDKTHL